MSAAEVLGRFREKRLVSACFQFECVKCCDDVCIKGPRRLQKCVFNSLQDVVCSIYDAELNRVLYYFRWEPHERRATMELGSILPDMIRVLTVEEIGADFFPLSIITSSRTVIGSNKKGPDELLHESIHAHGPLLSVDLSIGLRAWLNR